MRVFPFDPEAVGGELAAYASSGVRYSVLARSSGETQLACLRLEPGGKIGQHPAPVTQVFAVVAGDGWVRADAGEALPIAAGQAVFWEAGEGHESGAGERGMTVLVLEAERISRPDPA